MYSYNYNNKNIFLAKKLRKSQTKEELILWSLLRSRKFNGFKFRRQFPIGKYILDFYCIKKKLAIEIDGGQHNNENYILLDKERTEYLNSLEIKVIRFWNNEVNQNLNGIYETIVRYLS